MSFSTLSKRRKVDVENRTFNEKWESDYLFVDFNGKPQCLVCSQVMSVMKEYNIRHHYETTAKHKDKYNSVTGEACSRLISDLKSKLKRQKSTFFKETQIQTSSVQASYEVCMLLAKNQVSFRSGDIMKQSAI
jgi:ribosomal protein S18 acetylase RimI-like enzyme